MGTSVAAQRLIPCLLCALVAIGVTMGAQLPSPLMAAEVPQQLRGRVLQQAGNQFPGVDRGQSGIALAVADVVLVAGQLSPRQLGDPFLPARALTAATLARGRSRPDGSFALTLPATGVLPARATLLLKVPGGYYLNRFDDQGRFASIQLPQDLQRELLLNDDRSARY